jgi:hypothetical protein
LKADGILTARGGGTSHAAVTIPQLDKVGVVGFNKVHVYDSEGYRKVNGKRSKNIVAMMLEGAGFEVVDLGIDAAPQRFVETLKAENAQILAMSCLLTTTSEAFS